MLVAGGYPGKYEKGHTITGMENVRDAILFHAGTKREGDEVKTNGGRVIAVSAYGTDVNSAVTRALSQAALINFEGKNFRSDIGADLIQYGK
jgi:phosphoribosylamine--glycine ligase